MVLLELLRLLVVKRPYGWGYKATEHFVTDSPVSRQFCRVYLEPVPDDTTLLRCANLLGPQTAEELQVTRGRKLRVDSTVVETTIHYPGNSALLGDGVRVLSRLLRRAKSLLREMSDLGKEAFHTGTRRVRRLTQ